MSVYTQRPTRRASRIDLMELLLSLVSGKQTINSTKRAINHFQFRYTDLVSQFANQLKLSGQLVIDVCTIERLRWVNGWVLIRLPFILLTHTGVNVKSYIKTPLDEKAHFDCAFVILRNWILDFSPCWHHKHNLKWFQITTTLCLAEGQLVIDNDHLHVLLILLLAISSGTLKRSQAVS